ncbi:hypothetical protein EW146_g5380 [Bondarzewia mesenterica]|uniref:Carbohydrate esterase family 16 protein n=1 Tax=Bondarzewia mesenterica TaxID=1095465 RepID=A0A4S4LSA3_9AGAM|nr:hypothetical protein EW146_g5380 [Bondarzewia mesenterica]
MKSLLALISSIFIAAALRQPRDLVTGAPTPKPVFDWNAVKYVYAFGDSYSFVQGTAGHPNFRCKVEPSASSEMPFTFHSRLSIYCQTKLYPKISDGSNWLEFLTGCYEGRPFSCKRQLWDFAFAGADIDKTLLPLHHNFTVDLVDEVHQWSQYASHVIPHKPGSETMTFWWIGINDTGDVRGHNITNVETFWKDEMESYFQAVELAYAVGLRGTHLFINVPPGDRSPNSLGNPDNAAIQKQHIAEYNTALDVYVDQLAIAHPDLNVFIFDSNAWFNRVLDNSEQYGFNNVTSYCTCKNSTFFWYNAGHPTEHVHRLLAEAIEGELVDASV